MQGDIERVLISHEKIAQRVGELAAQIVADHTPPRMSGEAEITIVPILTGAMIFCCDLIRHIPFPMKIGLMTVSSYPGSSIRTQGSQVIGQQLGDIKGRHVLLIDDILDSGGTIKLVVPAVKALAPTQTEPPFLVAQLLALIVFIVLGIAAAIKFRPAPVA